MRKPHLIRGKRNINQLGSVTGAYNPSTWKADAGGLPVQGQPWLDPVLKIQRQDVITMLTEKRENWEIRQTQTEVL